MNTDGQDRQANAVAHIPAVPALRPTHLAEAPATDPHEVALDRLLEAMCLVVTASRGAARAYEMAFKVCAVSAIFGEQASRVGVILGRMENRLKAHAAQDYKHHGGPPTAA